jgi:hypothetical protein
MQLARKFDKVLLPLAINYAIRARCALTQYCHLPGGKRRLVSAHGRHATVASHCESVQAVYDEVKVE